MRRHELPVILFSFVQKVPERRQGLDPSGEYEVQDGCKDVVCL